MYLMRLGFKRYFPFNEVTTISIAVQPLKVWERFVNVYSILDSTHFENVFHHINNLHQNIIFTMEEESYRELAFLDTFSINTNKDDENKKKQKKTKKH